jgi:hypothetical protein
MQMDQAEEESSGHHGHARVRRHSASGLAWNVNVVLQYRDILRWISSNGFAVGRQYRKQELLRTFSQIEPFVLRV